MAALNADEFDEIQAQAVFDLLGENAIPAARGRNRRTIGLIVEAESFDQAAEVGLQHVELALGKAGVNAIIEEWRCEEIVSPRWKSRHVRIGSSGFGFSGGGRRGGGDSSGVREPRRPTPDVPTAGAAVPLPDLD